MFTKLAAIIVVVILLLSGITVATSNVFSAEKQIDTGVTLRVQAAGISNGTPAQMGNQAVARVRSFAASDKPLTAGSTIGEYSADYMGLVGYAWQLPRSAELADANEWAHTLRQNYAVAIPHQLLQSGDVLANVRAGNFGHALLFVQWRDPSLWSPAQALTDRAKTRARFEQGVQFIAYEVDRFNYPARVAPRQYTLKFTDGAMTIAELERELHGPYEALRSNRILGYVEMLAPVAVKFTTSANTVTAHFTILNRGGMPVTLEKIGVIAYGPDALHQGLAGTQIAFPQVNHIVLQPGQTYEYAQAMTIHQQGTFLVLARFDADGVAQMPALPAYFQITGQ